MSCDETPLPPPLKVAYHKRLIGEAAQHARNMMVLGAPNDPPVILIILRPNSSAVWNQSVSLAQKVWRSCPLGKMLGYR